MHGHVQKVAVLSFIMVRRGMTNLCNPPLIFFGQLSLELSLNIVYIFHLCFIVIYDVK